MKIQALVIATILVFGIVSVTSINTIKAAPGKDININTCKVLVDKQQCIITAKNIDDIRVGSIIVDVKGGYSTPPPPVTNGTDNSAAVAQLQSDVQKLQSGQDGMNQAIDDIDNLNIKQNAQLDSQNQTINILKQEVEQLKQTVTELKASSITDIGAINANTTGGENLGNITTPNEPGNEGGGGNGNTTSSNQPSDSSSTSEENDSNSGGGN